MVLAADAGGNGGARIGAALGCSLGPSPDSPSLAQRKAAELGRECSAETVSFLSQSYSRGLLKGKKEWFLLRIAGPFWGEGDLAFLDWAAQRQHTQPDNAPAAGVGVDYAA